MLKRPSLTAAWATWTLAATFYCYEYLLRILPSVMMDYLRELFSINGLTLGNLAGAYYYTYVPAQLPAGILMDRTGTRKILSFACLVCALGLYGFTSSNLYIAYIGRLLIGFGSSFSFIGVMKLATLYFPSSYFSLITGLTTSLGMLGAVLGNLTLVTLINSLGTQTVLLATAFFGLVLALSLYITIPELTHPLTVESKPNQRTQSSMMNLLKDSKIWVLGIIGCALLLSLTAFAEMWGIAYLTTQYNLPQEMAARYNALVFGGWAVGSPLMGYIASRFYAHQLPRFLSVNALLGALCFGLLLYAPAIASQYIHILLTLFGLFSSSQIIVFTIVRDLYPSDMSGIAFALTNLIMMLGGGLSQPIVGYLLDAFTEPKVEHLVHFSPQSFVFALTLIPIGFILAAVISHYSLHRKQ